MIFSIIALFVVIILFIIVSEIFTILFRVTGLPEKKARFQAVSLLTTSGFTTNESELIMKVSLRRRFARAAMILGYTFSAAFISVLVSLIISAGTDGNAETIEDLWILIGTLTAVLIVFILLTKVRFVKNSFDKFVTKLSFRLLKSKNDNIITIIDNYSTNIIAEVYLSFLPSLFANSTLEDTKIKQNYGIVVLAVARNNKIFTHVEKDFIFQKDDVVVLYGNEQIIKELFWEKHDSTEKQEVKEQEKTKNK